MVQFPRQSWSGSSPALQRALKVAERLAAGDSKVLITGESGVGKDVLARFVHVNSPRAAQRFVALNCASVAETLLESELFGHVKGSFTGAYRDKVGKLQQAHRGTIFLDEIGEMSLRMQAMLLRFLENGEVVPVGSDSAATRVDVRVISATNRNLHDMVAKGLFREDLLYRINVGQIEVPPLRERREDIAPLIEDVIAQERPAVADGEGDHGGAAALPLARQRARAAERGRADAGPGRRTYRRPGSAAGVRCWPSRARG